LTPLVKTGFDLPAGGHSPMRERKTGPLARPNKRHYTFARWLAERSAVRRWQAVTANNVLIARPYLL
jgi:hypothetical protein